MKSRTDFGGTVKKKRLAFVTNPLDSGFKSSISIVTLELAKRLTAGYDVTVYAGEGKEKKPAPAGVAVRRLHSRPDQTLRRLTGRLKPLYSLRKPFFGSSLYYPLYMTRLALDLRMGGFDIVHLHNFTQFIPVIRALNPGIKIVLHMHSEWLTQLDGETMKKRVRRADLILSCSEYITEKTKRSFPEAAHRCETLYNGVDLNIFAAPAEKLLRVKADRKKLLISVGRITPDKGVHIVIEAFNILARKYPDIELCHIGQERITPKEFLVELSDDPKVRSLKAFYPGSYKERVMERLSPSFSPRVSFLGHVDYQEMVIKYAEAMIFMNASYHEPFGMPVAEAMACGLPVVAARTGGIREIVEDKTSGLLFEPGDADSLSEGVTKLLENEQMRRAFTQAGRSRVTNLFNWDTIASRLDELYHAMARS